MRVHALPWMLLQKKAGHWGDRRRSLSGDPPSLWRFQWTNELEVPLSDVFQESHTNGLLFLETRLWGPSMRQVPIKHLLMPWCFHSGKKGLSHAKHFFFSLWVDDESFLFCPDIYHAKSSGILIQAASHCVWISTELFFWANTDGG